MKLKILRKKLDKIDKKIIKLLAKRMRIVKKIAKIKFEKNLKALQPKRREFVLNSRKKFGKDKGLEETLIEKIWNNIHEYSLKIQNKLLDKSENETEKKAD